MTDQSDVASCGNLFDLCAILYRLCEDRAGDRRFHRLKAALADDPALMSRFQDFQKRLDSKVAPLIQATDIRSLCGDKPPKELGTEFHHFQGWLHEAGFPLEVAAWAVLSVLDMCFTPEHASDLRVLHEDRLVLPLNANWQVGFPSVFLKIHSPVASELTPLHSFERTADANLHYLAIIEDMDPQVRLMLDSQLWSDLSQVPLAVAVISPSVEATDFEILSPQTQRSSARVFWVEARESEKYRDQIIDQLHACDEAGAAIAVLPELASSATLERVVSGQRFSSLRVIVLGSRHATSVDDSVKAKLNQCTVAGRDGEAIWQQCKRERYVIPPEVTETMEVLFPHKGQEEWIQTDRPQIMMLTPVGGMAVQICLDFLQDKTRRLLCQLGCRWFLVPALQGSLDWKFRKAVEDCGDRSGAVCAIANSRCGFEWAKERAKPRQLRRLYQPKRGASSAGMRVHRGTWLLKLNEWGKDDG